MLSRIGDGNSAANAGDAAGTRNDRFLTKAEFEAMLKTPGRR